MNASCGGPGRALTDDHRRAAPRAGHPPPQNLGSRCAGAKARARATSRARAGEGARRVPGQAGGRRPAYTRSSGAQAAQHSCRSRRRGSTATRWECRCAPAPRHSTSPSVLTLSVRAPYEGLEIEGLLAREPSDSADSPSGYCSGSTPIPPGSSGGCARRTRRARSGCEQAVPSPPVSRRARAVLLPPARIAACRPRRSPWRRRRSTSPRVLLGHATLVPGASWLRRRMLANVPRIITSWLPRASHRS